MMNRRKLSRLHRTRRAASLVEVAMASLLVGVLLVAALNSVGARLRHQAMLTDRQHAHLLAEELLAEVLQHRYEDPDEAPVFGVESSESGGTRAPFDDVDDYHSWDQSPPQDRAGTPMTNGSRWRRTVSVEYVLANDMTTTSGSDQGIKRVTVTVFLDDEPIVSVVGIRSRAWEDACATY